MRVLKAQTYFPAEQLDRNIVLGAREPMYFIIYYCNDEKVGGRTSDQKSFLRLLTSIRLHSNSTELSPALKKRNHEVLLLYHMKERERGS
jgi:hypothetical protein